METLNQGGHRERENVGPVDGDTGSLHCASMPPLDADRLLTAEEVAQRLSIPTKRVYELDIRVVKLGQKTYRWRLGDVEEYIRTHSTSPRTARRKKVA